MVQPSFPGTTTESLTKTPACLVISMRATQMDWADGSTSISTDPSHGTSSIHPTDGNWTYIPNPHFIGNDSFWVTVTDDQGYTTNQVISIVVNPVDNNGAAIISGDNNGVIDEDTSLSGDLDASDPDGLADGSYFSISTDPSHGISSIHPTDGNWTYIPNPHFIGNDSPVVVIDDQGCPPTSRISIVVNLYRQWQHMHHFESQTTSVIGRRLLGTPTGSGCELTHD